MHIKNKIFSNIGSKTIKIYDNLEDCARFFLLLNHRVEMQRDNFNIYFAPLWIAFKSVQIGSNI